MPAFLSASYPVSATLGRPREAGPGPLPVLIQQFSNPNFSASLRHRPGPDLCWVPTGISPLPLIANESLCRILGNVLNCLGNSSSEDTYSFWKLRRSKLHADTDLSQYIQKRSPCKGLMEELRKNGLAPKTLLEETRSSTIIIKLLLPVHISSFPKRFPEASWCLVSIRITWRVCGHHLPQTAQSLNQVWMGTACLTVPGWCWRWGSWRRIALSEAPLYWIP